MKIKLDGMHSVLGRHSKTLLLLVMTNHVRESRDFELFSNGK